MRILASLAAAFLAAVPASAVDAPDEDEVVELPEEEDPFAGTYVAEGDCPEGRGEYRASLLVESFGFLNYTLTWDDGEAVIYGSAIKFDDRLVILFRDPDGFEGLAEITRFEDRRYGRKAILGDERVCYEVWARSTTDE